MACRWTYNKNGDINGAKTQSGAPSVLFQELQNKFGLEKAIEMYEVSQSDEFAEVASPIIGEITPKTSTNYANLTEDGQGNFVFYHVGAKGYDVIKRGSGQNSATSRSEASALSRVGGVTMYYPAENVQESMFSGEAKYLVKIPKEKVYDFNRDKLNLLLEAEKQFREAYPGQAFDKNNQLSFLTKVANERGFDAVVAEWDGTTRVQTTKEFKPQDFQLLDGNTIIKDFKKDNKFKSNKDKGWKSIPTIFKQQKLKSIYERISDTVGNDFSNPLYNLRDMSSYSFEDRFAPFKSQELITEAVNNSNISQELKQEYLQVLDSQDVLGYSENTYDSGEPKAELVVNYITEQNKSNKPLSQKQKVDLNNVMQATGIYSTDELEKTLVDVFYDENNIFVINPQKIRNSGLYSEYELRNLLDNQEMVKQAVEALQSTPREEEGFVETSEKELFDKTSEFNSFGKLNVVSPQKIKEEIFEKTVGLDREQFGIVLNNLEYPNYLKTVDRDALFAEVSQYYKAEALQEVNGQIVPTTVDNTDVELSLVNREYSDDLVNVVSHISKILDQGSFNIYEDLKTLETLASKVGLNLVGITDKFITQEFLDEIALFLTEQPNNFSQLYKDIFVKNENQKFDLVKKVAGKDLDLVTLNTTLSEEQLYNDYGLIKVSEGVYTRMNKIPLEELYERVGLALDRGNLQQYVRENVTNLENFKNSDNAEAVVLYKLYLNENEQLSQTESNQIERGGEIATRVSNFLRRQGGTNEKNSAIRQKIDLENFAKKEGYWIANYRKLGEYIGKGMESQVFLSKDGTKVYKVNDLEFYDTPLTYLNTIKEHNRLFPESSYRVIGFTERTDTENFSFIVEQPFIEAIRGASQEEVNKELERLGFSAVGQAESYIKDNIEILDLHEGNVIVDKNGNIFFIDPVIFVEEIIVRKPKKNTAKLIGDYKYLTEKFPTDFRTKIIEEKVKDSLAYKEFYSNFGVNSQGIYLKTDNIKNADIYADENLKQYSLLSKQLPDLTTEDISIEQSKRDTLYNNPESISPFKGQYSKLSDNEIIIKNTSEEFLKVDGEIYEFLEKNGNLSLFAKVGRNTSNYNVVNLEKPSSNVNLEAFAYLETKPEAFIKTKNLLSKEERQNAEENFEC